MLGISFVDGDHHFDTSTFVHHKVPNTSGNILFKGVVNDNGTSIFQGMIRIDHDAQHTDSFMGNHNLLLSNDARADSIPKLEIEADDVRASHGVTVGQVDEEQLFYLKSRGIKEEDAEEMIVGGFLESIVNMADQTTEQERLRYFIKKKRERNVRD
jgi:Fe-S cluster assembly protein SufD